MSEMDYMSKTGLGAMAYMNMMGWWAMDLIGLRVMGKGQLVAAGTVVTLGISLSLLIPCVAIFRL